MLKKMIFAAFLILFVVWAFGCESVAEPTVPEPVDTTYQGEWTGTTAQGLTVFFTVTGNLITSFGIDIRKADNNSTVSYSLSEITNIYNGSFSVQAKAPAPTQEGSITADWVYVSGTFTSAAAAEGSAGNQTNQIPPTSWSAEKE